MPSRPRRTLQTNLRTGPAPAPDDALNTRLSALAQALSPLLDDKPVVFHDMQGAFAPVVDDPDTAHIFLHAVPVSARTRSTAPRPANPLPEGLLSDTPLPRLNPPSTQEGSFARLEVTKAEARGQIIAHTVASCAFVTVRPGPEDGPIDPEIALEVLGYILLSSETVLGPLRAAPGRISPAPRRTRPSELDQQSVERIQDIVPAARSLIALLDTRRQDLALQRTLETAIPDPAAHLRQELQQLNGIEANLRESIQCTQSKLRELRHQHLSQLRTNTDDRATRIAAQIREIRAMPQVLDARAEQMSSQTMLRIDLRPMALGAHIRKRKDIALLPPLTVHLAVRLGGGPLLEVREPTGARIPHPHVRNTRPCLGSASEGLTESIRDGNLLAAVHLVIGFLQSFNSQDAWGRSAANWVAPETETGRGNTVRLAPPAATA